jgi:prepilin-type N-terminal cleavage/methylation domain-containing protein
MKHRRCFIESLNWPLDATNSDKRSMHAFAIPPCRRNHSRKGLTLIEVLAALLVLTLVLAGSIEAARQSQKTTHAAWYYARATSVLNERIEELRSMPFDSVDASRGDASAASGRVWVDDAASHAVD